MVKWFKWVCDTHGSANVSIKESWVIMVEKLYGREERMMKSLAIISQKWISVWAWSDLRIYKERIREVQETQIKTNRF
jgi:hypothetical protein